MSEKKQQAVQPTEQPLSQQPVSEGIFRGNDGISPSYDTIPTPESILYLPTLYTATRSDEEPEKLLSGKQIEGADLSNVGTRGGVRLFRIVAETPLTEEDTYLSGRYRSSSFRVLGEVSGWDVETVTFWADQAVARAFKVIPEVPVSIQNALAVARGEKDVLTDGEQEEIRYYGMQHVRFATDRITSAHSWLSQAVSNLQNALYRVSQPQEAEYRELAIKESYQAVACTTYAIGKVLGEEANRKECLWQIEAMRFLLDEPDTQGNMDVPDFTAEFTRLKELRGLYKASITQRITERNTRVEELRLHEKQVAEDKRKQEEELVKTRNELRQQKANMLADRLGISSSTVLSVWGRFGHNEKEDPQTVALMLDQATYNLQDEQIDKYADMVDPEVLVHLREFKQARDSFTERSLKSTELAIQYLPFLQQQFEHYMHEPWKREDANKILKEFEFDLRDSLNSKNASDIEHEEMLKLVRKISKSVIRFWGSQQAYSEISQDVWWEEQANQTEKECEEYKSAILQARSYTKSYLGRSESYTDIVPTFAAGDAYRYNDNGELISVPLSAEGGAYTRGVKITKTLDLEGNVIRFEATLNTRESRIIWDDDVTYGRDKGDFITGGLLFLGTWEAPLKEAHAREGELSEQMKSGFANISVELRKAEQGLILISDNGLSEEKVIARWDAFLKRWVDWRLPDTWKKCGNNTFISGEQWEQAQQQNIIIVETDSLGLSQMQNQIFTAEVPSAQIGSSAIHSRSETTESKEGTNDAFQDSISEVEEQANKDTAMWHAFKKAGFT